MFALSSTEYNKYSNTQRTPNNRCVSGNTPHQHWLHWLGASCGILKVQPT
jgi:hypothetical protein